MNPLAIAGGALLALGLLILIVTMLRRPAKSSEHLTVAALQRRLAEEDAPAVDETAERLVAPEMEHASAQQRES
ncbi:hypothetical protein NONI108955_08410 [Nocardia ninae]|uniref:Uncharacterized protein n=1 Tax=Nocardia ninae NBRC 108245 TaxID=1210091 RepID=A0A511MKW2_9NOCA|nr:hypothetical protein [Nocardia ninae]GEM41081.1 hypothetical protein NN4_56000 [Nocardia ninae NBRC 108245]